LVNARNTYAIITVSALNALVAFLALITLNTGWALLTVITPWTLRSLRAGLTHWALLTLRPSDFFDITDFGAGNLASYKLKDLN
jgi:hypothetical protein